MLQIISRRGAVEHSLNQHSPAAAVLRGWDGVGWGEGVYEGGGRNYLCSYCSWIGGVRLQ